MYILVPGFFEKEFLSLFKSDKFLLKFLKKLKERENNNFKLNHKYYKYKFYLEGISVRGVIYLSFSNENNIHHPIFIDKKSSKGSDSSKKGKIGGDNLKLDKKTADQLWLRESKLRDDIKNNYYKRYLITYKSSDIVIYRIYSNGRKVKIDT